MGLLDKLFATSKSIEKPYVDAGVRLTHKLVQSLQLDGWPNGLPAYTRAEAEAIDAGLSRFQQIANEVMGGTAVFHPEAAEPIQRMQAAQALEDLAGQDWEFSDKSELPANWKARVSTYLKAWACHLNPDALLQMGEMLSKAGYKTEARESYSVVILFPTYAHIFFGGSDKTAELASSIVRQAEEALRSLGR
jgi:hypothetical protein